MQVMTENKAVPKLRFREFKDDWINLSLGELLTFKNGLNSDKDKYGSGVRFINVLDIIENNFTIKKGRNKIKIKSFEVQHGLIKATAYIVNKVAYLSDCSFIPAKSRSLLYDLDYLIIDCLRIKFHPGHFNLKTALSLAKEFRAKKTILTNLHVDFDYNKLKKNYLPI